MGWPDSLLCYLALIQHGEEFAHQFFIPQSGVSFLAHGDGGLIVTQGRFVGAGRAQGVVNIHHLQNARQQGNFTFEQSIGIAAAVGMLVMMADDRQDEPQ